MFLWYCMVLAPPNLMCNSMSTIGIWVLHVTPSRREPPPESLSSYTSPLGAHHSSPMSLGRVYGVDEIMAFGADY